MTEGLTMTDEDIEKIRGLLQTELAPVNTKLATIQAELVTIKATLQEHTNAIEMLRQDTGLIRLSLDAQTRLLDMLQQDMRMLRGAVNDLAKENVTPGEVEAIHHDLNRMQRELAELHVVVDKMRRP
jgi:chromosome segregation ATPase